MSVAASQLRLGAGVIDLFGEFAYLYRIKGLLVESSRLAYLVFRESTFGPWFLNLFRDFQREYTYYSCIP